MISDNDGCLTSLLLTILFCCGLFVGIAFMAGLYREDRCIGWCNAKNYGYATYSDSEGCFCSTEESSDKVYQIDFNKLHNLK